MNFKPTYISLFSSAGVGCYGFKTEGFSCVATSELIERRLNVQKVNNKCKYDNGYVLGDITEPKTKEALFKAVNEYKEKEKIKDIDVVIATAPCQGMSVANHKKSDNEIIRNSLVVEAIELVCKIKPKFFIFENVRAFMNTNCYDHNEKLKIGDAIFKHLSCSYSYVDKVINFKDYGANSSRTRTLVIGVRKDLSNEVSPLELFPKLSKEKTLNDLISNLPSLSNMGEISENDIYHSFRKYQPHMRDWIKGIKEGDSAFDNKELVNRPHQIVNGNIVENVNKNGDKYKRQVWSKVAPCIHTRNDILSSQNTIHPKDDRVFSVRELMILMNIPSSFKWVEQSEFELNSMDLVSKQEFIKTHDINIRQSIGEAVPTIIFKEIANSIKSFLNKTSLNDSQIKKLIKEHGLNCKEALLTFIDINKQVYSLSTLTRIAELSNSSRQDNAAYYTDNDTLLNIYSNLPDFPKKRIKVLEPSVGIGSFFPILFHKYEEYDSVEIDAFDIDPVSIETCKLLNKIRGIPENFKINYINEDFIKYENSSKYDLAVGNPPFLKFNKNHDYEIYKFLLNDIKAKNLSALFLDKCIAISDYTSLIMPKYFLSNEDFSDCRELANRHKIELIIDFGEHGFKGVLIETIAVFINTRSNRSKTRVISINKKISNLISQNDMTSDKFPGWIIYRNEKFNKIANMLIFDIFTSFRDRQLTNKELSECGDIEVIKSRNIKRDGSGIESIDGYDRFISKEILSKSFSVFKYLERDDVYLCPNMTYYPRVIKKPKCTLVNGSVAILELKDKSMKISNKDLQFWNSTEFEEFYAICRNYSTRSLNIDNNSVKFFGIRR